MRYACALAVGCVLALWTVSGFAQGNRLSVDLLESIANEDTTLNALIDVDRGLAWVYASACETDEEIFDVGVLSGARLEERLGAIIERTTRNIEYGLEDDVYECDADQLWCMVVVARECSPTLYLQFEQADSLRLIGIFDLDEDFRRDYPEQYSMWLDRQWQAVRANLAAMDDVPSSGVLVHAYDQHCREPSDCRGSPCVVAALGQMGCTGEICCGVDECYNGCGNDDDCPECRPSCERAGGNWASGTCRNPDFAF